MKLIWEDGHFIEREFGAKVIGLKHEGKRPKYVQFSKEELLHLVSGDRLTDEYVYYRLATSLEAGK
jgi:hypothetical protein